VPSPILLISLEVPEAVETTHIEDESWLLRAVTRVPDQTILAFGVPGLTKDENIGRLFPELEPDDNGEFTIELGTILYDRLPRLGEQGDFTVEVPDDDDNSLQLWHCPGFTVLPTI
jgi:hypothetical protein